MRQLVAPRLATIDIHHRLLANVHPPVTKKAFFRKLAARFRHYERMAPKLRRFNPRPAGFGHLLEKVHGVYDSDANEAKEFRDAIRRCGFDRCPYCGRTRPPSQIDHFLPRSVFPEFSFFSVNLVPSCPDCNRVKDKDIWNQAGVRLFLHPYYDRFLGLPFVHLKIVPERTEIFYVPLFEFVFDAPNMSSNDRDTCDSHFDKLGIRRDLERHFASLLRAEHRRVERSIAVAGYKYSDLDDKHRIDEENFTREFGPNCWEAIFARGIYSNQSLMTFLLTQPASRGGAITR